MVFLQASFCTLLNAVQSQTCVRNISIRNISEIPEGRAKGERKKTKATISGYLPKQNRINCQLENIILSYLTANRSTA